MGVVKGFGDFLGTCLTEVHKGKARSSKCRLRWVGQVPNTLSEAASGVLSGFSARPQNSVTVGVTPVFAGCYSGVIVASLDNLNPSFVATASQQITTCNELAELLSQGNRGSDSAITEDTTSTGSAIFTWIMQRPVVMGQ